MKQAITLTFGDCAENNVGMEILGKRADKGLTLADLETARDEFARVEIECQIIDLVAAGEVFEHEPQPAWVLVARLGARAMIDQEASEQALYAEQSKLPVDKLALMRGQVKNKIARHNLCFADEEQEPDYEAGRGRVINFSDVPCTSELRMNIPRFFGEKTANLLAEGNYYYDVNKCGIGFHGDAERSIVVAVRLGEPIPLHFQWFKRHGPIGKRIELMLGAGDIYAFSEKAVGADWKRSVIPTLRHAAGAPKYLRIK